MECIGYEADNDLNPTKVFCKIVESPDKVKATIHWVDANDAVPVTIKEYDALFLAKEPGARTGDFIDDVNPNSLVVKEGFGEPGIKDVKEGSTLQFLRSGYYVKNADGSFNKTVGLRSSFKE